MISVGLAALAAFAWGASDFCGGKAAQREDALAAAVVSQILGLPVILLCVLLIPGHLQFRDFAFATVAGIAEFAAIVLLYRGLASGAMTIVAPTAAASTAVSAMVIGLAADPIPGELALGGAGCVVLAIPLVCRTQVGGPACRPGIVLALPITLAVVAGVMFGAYFTLLGQAAEGSGAWPILALKSATISLGLFASGVRRTSLRMPKQAMTWVAVAGVGDAAANVLYLLAARDGPLCIIAPVAAVAPMGTVILAMAIDRERIRPLQIAGLGLSATAIVLIAI